MKTTPLQLSEIHLITLNNGSMFHSWVLDAGTAGLKIGRKVNQCNVQLFTHAQRVGMASNCSKSHRDARLNRMKNKSHRISELFPAARLVRVCLSAAHSQHLRVECSWSYNRFEVCCSAVSSENISSVGLYLCIYHSVSLLQYLTKRTELRSRTPWSAQPPKKP